MPAVWIVAGPVVDVGLADEVEVGVDDDVVKFWTVAPFL